MVKTHTILAFLSLLPLISIEGSFAVKQDEFHRRLILPRREVSQASLEDAPKKIGEIQSLVKEAYKEEEISDRLFNQLMFVSEFKLFHACIASKDQIGAARHFTKAKDYFSLGTEFECDLYSEIELQQLMAYYCHDIDPDLPEWRIHELTKDRQKPNRVRPRERA